GQHADRIHGATGARRGRQGVVAVQLLAGRGWGRNAVRSGGALVHVGAQPGEILEGARPFGTGQVGQIAEAAPDLPALVANQSGRLQAPFGDAPQEQLEGDGPEGDHSIRREPTVVAVRIHSREKKGGCVERTTPGGPMLAWGPVPHAGPRRRSAPTESYRYD